MTKILKIIIGRSAPKLEISIYKLYPYGGLITMIGGVLLITFGEDQKGFGAIAMGFSIIALGYASLSGRQILALTHLNFDEKMAMMEKYYDAVTMIDTEKSPRGTYDLGRVLDECKYDLRAVCHLRYLASAKVKEDLIKNHVVKIIKDAEIKDTCNNNREKICELIKICLEIAPLIDLRRFKICSTYQELESINERLCSHT